ncbi:unnamed protein product [Chironomus riparius]|uniref:C2H2-type domain-containing protein n=1 Tax=Chironomus riparius TaxID=315576 RepID=A0A9N9WZ38_9DIPT|nr:unnamed protein product [Chironomus riparius]
MSDTDLQNITPTYFKIEVKDEPDEINFIKSESISFDDSISQYIVRGSFIDDQFVIPSTSHDFSMLIEEVKHEPEEILQDLILPEVEEIEEIEEISEIQEIEADNEGFEIIEEQAIAYEVKRNAQGELECPICLAIFKIGANLERHIQIHDKKFVFNLTKTNDVQTNYTEAAATTAKAMLPSYPCEYCNEVSMSSINEDQNNITAWNDEAKAAFSDFKKKRRNLPSPSDVDSSRHVNKKYKNTNFSNVHFNSRMSNRHLLVDRNRALFAEHNDPFVSVDNNVKSSTLSENFVSMDVSELESDKTEVACDEINKNIAQLRDMIAKREDPYAILDKIAQQMADTHKNNQVQFSKVAADCARYATRQNDQLVALENRIMAEISKVHQLSEDRLNAIEFSQKCSAQNNIVWLSFADSTEIEALRIKTKSELIREAVKILSRMDIWNSMNNRTIVDAFTQKVSVKTGKGFENEMIMGIKFLNSFTARDVKRLAAQYAKKQFMSKNFDAIRYIVRDNWSAEVWKILRVCYDLTRIKLIDRALVSDAGIQVYYKKKVTDQNGIEEEKNLRALIRLESDLDELRVDVNDVGLAIPTFQIYNGDYFKMNFDARSSYRMSIDGSNNANSIEPQVQTAATTSDC